jgi:hypothetical protein
MRRMDKNDDVYRATIVVEQRMLSDDSVIQTWTAHSKAYTARSQGATLWFNATSYEIRTVEKRVRDKYAEDIIQRGTSTYKTYETLVEGSGIFMATEWTPKPKKGK